MGVCCYTFLKYVVMIFNFLYMMLGGVLLGTVLWIYLDGAGTAPVTKDIEGYNYVLFFLMAVGAIMFIMGFLGCCGACQESQCMLATFFALVFVLFVGQIAAGVWMKTNEKRFLDLVTQGLRSAIENNYGTNNHKTEAFDLIQMKLECCGAEGPTDWAEARLNSDALEVGVAGSHAEYKVPRSCCVNPGTDDCDDDRNVSLSGIGSGIYSEGCAKKMILLMEEHSYEVLAVIGLILLIEILAMIFSMVLCCTVRRIDHVKA